MPSPLPPVAAVAAGRRHSLALGKSGAVVGWGFVDSVDAFVDLAAAPTGCVGNPAAVPKVCASGAHEGEICVAGADCAYDDPTSGATLTPSCVPLGDVEAIAAGLDHSLALRNGRVIAWGCGGAGQLAVPGGTGPIAAIAAHGDASFAVTHAGKVAAFGAVPGALGEALATATNVKRIASAGSWALLLHGNGQVEAVGDGGAAITSELSASIVSADSPVDSVAAGDGWAAVLLSTGAILLAGEPPEGAEDINQAARIGAGASHLLAVRTCVFVDQDGDGGIDPDTEPCTQTAASQAVTPETVLAILHFDGEGAASDFEVVRKDREDTIQVKKLGGAEPPELFDPAGRFDQLEGAELSPAADRLLLAAIANARPTVQRTQDLHDASESQSLFVQPSKLSGMSWVREERVYPCNWVGGYRNPTTGLYRWPDHFRGHRGGLDDLRIYSGRRTPESIRSEAERGIDSLVSQGMDGPVPSQAATCTTSHLECPAFHLCIAGQCQVHGCDPNDETSSDEYGGRCTLRPLGVTQDEPGPGGVSAAHDWVCAADCMVDDHCYTQECLNGPCRYCDPESLTCLECRTVQNAPRLVVGGLRPRVARRPGGDATHRRAESVVGLVRLHTGRRPEHPGDDHGLRGGGLRA